MPDTIRGFLDTAAEQIRWNKARKPLLDELSSHLLEQKDACMAEGMTPEEAEREALRQMGDPVVIGSELDRIHRPRPQWGLLLTALVLLIVCGFLRNLLTVPVRTDDHKLLDIMSMVLGTVCLFFGYSIDISFVGKWIGVLLPLFFGGILILLLPLTGRIFYISGKFWLVERILLLFPALLAALLWSRRGRGWSGLLVSLAALLAGLLTAVTVPSVFTFLMILISGSVLCLFFARQDWFGIGQKWGTALTLLLTLSIGSASLFALLPRLKYDIFPHLDPNGRGYLAFQIRKALSCAQWVGHANVDGWEAATGLSFYQLVPEPEGICLPVQLICKLGWLPFLALMTVFGAFFLWVFWKTLGLRQLLGRTVALAVLMTLLVQAGAGLLTALGLPVFTASFPLLVGNCASVVNAFLIGLALSAFRNGALPETPPFSSRNVRYRLKISLEKV